MAIMSREGEIVPLSAAQRADCAEMFRLYSEANTR
jgi:hypothetical protein